MSESASTHYKQNRLQQLRGFCYAAQSGSISRAAARMGLTQPSVSLQIQALEREFGVSLFNRSGPRIQLTDAGRQLLELADPLVQGMDELPAEFSTRRGEAATGRVSIAAGESTILYILPKYVQEFAKLHPRVEINLVNVTGRDGLALLRKGEVDFAFGSMIEIPDDVQFVGLFKFTPTLITPLKHPLARRRGITLADIAQYPMILPPAHLSTWRIVTMIFGQHGLTMNSRLRAGGWEVIKRYVALGLGISIVPDLCLSPRDRLGKIPVDRYFPIRKYGPVLRRGRALSPQARRFLHGIDPNCVPTEPSAVRTLP